jgi:hypothetical protein
MESVMMDSAISTVGQSAASQPQGQDTLSLEQAIEFPIRLNREAALQVCREQGGRIPTRVELETICRKMGGKHLGESHYAGFDLNPSQDGADRIYWLGDSDSVPTSDEGNYYWAMQLWRTSDASAAVLTFQFSEQPFSEMTDLNVICLKN